jgi:hypothetical protein
VRLDVHHVAEAKERLVVQARAGIGPIEGFRARAAGRSQILFEVEALPRIPAEVVKMSWVHIFRYEPRGRADLAAS